MVQATVLPVAYRKLLVCNRTYASHPSSCAYSSSPYLQSRESCPVMISWGPIEPLHRNTVTELSMQPKVLPGAVA